MKLAFPFKIAKLPLAKLLPIFWQKKISGGRYIFSFERFFPKKQTTKITCDRDAMKKTCKKKISTLCQNFAKWETKAILAFLYLRQATFPTSKARDMLCYIKCNEFSES